ncbi:MAG: hypothetical protein P1Q69_09305, partial [Candidatus Thorarchaeota archaeon]|nr:hypothetical protein [Candidatus Thorarchaeota archaeon]
MDPSAAEPYIRSICHHEIQHYLVCPYDGVTNGMLFAAARKHLPDSVAMFVCNVFADLVVDSKLLKRFPTLTHSRINTSIHDSSLRTREHSPLWKLVVATYRVMWGFPVPYGVDIDKPTIQAAEDVVSVAKSLLDYEHKWPKATEAIAKIVKEWLQEEDEELQGGLEVSSQGGDGTGGYEITIRIPADLDGIMGSPVEDRNGDRARKCVDPDSIENSDEIMERLAIEVEARDGSLKDLESV